MGGNLSSQVDQQPLWATKDEEGGGLISIVTRTEEKQHSCRKKREISGKKITFLVGKENKKIMAPQGMIISNWKLLCRGLHQLFPIFFTFRNLSNAELNNWFKFYTNYICPWQSLDRQSSASRPSTLRFGGLRTWIINGWSRRRNLNKLIETFMNRPPSSSMTCDEGNCRQTRSQLWTRMVHRSRRFVRSFVVRRRRKKEMTGSCFPLSLHYL